MRSCVRCWDLRRKIVPARFDIADEPLCGDCFDDEAQAAKARLYQALRYWAAHGVKVPRYGLPANPGLFD